jgi:hypothetical protein
MNVKVKVKVKETRKQRRVREGEEGEEGKQQGRDRRKCEGEVPGSCLNSACTGPAPTVKALTGQYVHRALIALYGPEAQRKISQCVLYIWCWFTSTVRCTIYGSAG